MNDDEDIYSYNAYKSELLKHSEEKSDFRKALKEWKLNEVINGETYGDDRCICTHKIKDIYYIKNMINGNILKNGCECINKLTESDIRANMKLYNKYKKKVEAILNPHITTKYDRSIKKIFNEYEKQKTDLYTDMEEQIKYSHVIDKKRIIHLQIILQNKIKDISKTYDEYEKKKTTLYTEEVLKNKKFFNNYQLKFGKYKNTNIKDVPMDYIKWCYNNNVNESISSYYLIMAS